MELLIQNYSICGLAIVEGRTFDQCVGIAIKAFSINREIRQADLASFIGTGAANMSKLVNGQTSMTMAHMLKLSAAFKIPPATLIDLACDIYSYPNNPHSKWVKK